MPRKALHPCNWPRCPLLTRRRFCAKHEDQDTRAARARREKELVALGKRASRLYRRGIAWRQLRARHLKGQPFCVECDRRGRRIRATDVDHIKPHHGDTRLFFDPSNLQSLCHSCHSAKTAREVGFVKGSSA